MATRYALTGDVNDLLGGEVRRAHVRIVTNLPPRTAVIDSTNKTINLGAGALTVGTDGKFSASLIATDATDLNVTGLQYRVIIEAAATGGREVFDSGFFSLTADADIAELDLQQPALVPSGSGSGSSALIVVNGGTVDLPDAQPDGWLVGYRVTAPTTIEGMSFAPGSYVFERDSAVASGWTYRTLAASDPLTPAGGDTTAPTAPTLTVDNSAPTQLVATFSGGTDAVGVTQYRSRIDAGAWTVGTSPRTFTGLTASTSYTIDVQAGDAAGNWSPSATWTGSTAAASLTPAAVGSLYAHYDASALSALTISTGTSVSAWNDQGANNLDLVAATAQPEQVTLNGLPAVQFTAASSDRMRYVGGFLLPTTPGFTVCGVIRSDSSTAGYAVSSANGNLNLQPLALIFANGSVTADRPRPATGTAVFFAAVVDAAGVTFRIGSSTTTTAGTTTALGGNFALGAFYSGAGSDFTDITVGETWVHNTALTGGQLDSLHAYAQAKWGVA